MTTNGMSYGDRNGLQDEPKKPRKPYGSQPAPSTNNSKPKNELPNILLCFKQIEKPKDKSKEKKAAVEETSKSKKSSVKRSKSRELRGGVLYVGCDCERRNGLQDACPRSACQGAPECMTHPPTCPPSEFAQNKHMVKKFEKLAKEREEFAKKMKEKKSGGGAGGGEHKSDKSHKDHGKVDYDCFPLDELMKDGLPCPICDRALEGCSSDKHKPNIVVGPIIIDFDEECMCPQAV